MKKKRDKDFILKDKTMKVVLVLSAPLVLSNLITVLYDLADGLWLARLSTSAFTATGLTSSIIFLFASAGLGLSMGGTTLIAQSIGAGNKDRASNYAKHLLIIGLFIGILFSVSGYFLAPYIMNFMGAKGELYQASTTYLSLMAIGFVFDSIIFMFQAILNSQGKTGRTTIIGLTSGLLNMVLDPIFIFETVPFINTPGLNYGVAGAAIATVVSKFIALMVGFKFIYSKDNELDMNFKGFKFSKRYNQRILQMSIPTAIARSTTALGFTVCNAFIMALGEEVLTAFALINRINTLFMQFSMGIGSALTAIVGQNIGAKLIERTRQLIKDGFLLSIITSAIGVIIVYIWQNDVISVFIDPNQNELITRYTIEYANYALINIPAMGLFFIYMALFQGIGKMKLALNLSLIRLWGFRVPLLLFFIYLTSLNQLGVWISTSISNTIVLFWAHYKYKTDDLLYPKL